MKRENIDLGHFNFNLGRIGCLQTLACIPVAAGDSLSLNYEGVFRLTPLRRQLTVDCHVDMFSFFVPHRHIYGSDWTDFLLAGHDEAVTFDTVTNTDNLNLSYMTSYYATGDVMPLWRPAGYNRIWNRYFRSPTDSTGELADTAYLNGQTTAVSGKACGPLPVPWSTGVKDAVPDSAREVDVVTDTIDLVDFRQTQMQYANDVDRQFFAQRYTDLLGKVWGTGVNIDADQRPELVAHDTWWLSGHDVDGTSDATLGQYAGKSAGLGRHRIRRKHFNEHGALWVMCLLRFPTIHEQETPYLFEQSQPTYLDIAADGDLISAQPPVEVHAADYFKTSTDTTNLGVVPYGQHYRYHPSMVHPDYDFANGFSFINTIPTTQDAAWYLDDTEYDDVFQTLQLQHWQVSGRFDISGSRTVGSAVESLYTGS